jgi:hypothetical protein
MYRSYLEMSVVHEQIVREGIENAQMHAKKESKRSRASSRVYLFFRYILNQYIFSRKKVRTFYELYN